MKKKDFILIAIVLCAAAAISLFYWYIGKQDSDKVVILVNGEEYETLNLHKDNEITIKSSNGGTNVLVIKDGIAEVVEASCPDKVCVYQGSIHQNGEMIVCLPNEVLIKVVQEKGKGFDGVAGSILKEWRTE